MSFVLIYYLYPQHPNKLCRFKVAKNIGFVMFCQNQTLLAFATIKTATHSQCETWPCLSACTLTCTVWVGVHIGTIKGTREYSLLENWEQQISDRSFLEKLENFYVPCCFSVTKDVLSLHKRQPGHRQQTQSPLPGDFFYSREEWRSDLAGQSAWPIQDRAGEAKAETCGVGVLSLCGQISTSGYLGSH